MTFDSNGVPNNFTTNATSTVSAIQPSPGPNIQLLTVSNSTFPFTLSSLLGSGLTLNLASMTVNSVTADGQSFTPTMIGIGGNQTTPVIDLYNAGLQPSNNTAQFSSVSGSRQPPRTAAATQASSSPTAA